MFPRLSFEENARQTKEAVEALKAINPAILVEGEIGNIGTGSEIHQFPSDLSKYLTTPEEAKQFVEFTGVDVLAPAVGNLHGMSPKMVEGENKKRLDIKESLKSRLQHEFRLLFTAVREPMMRIYGGQFPPESALFISIQNCESHGEAASRLGCPHNPIRWFRTRYCHFQSCR